MTDPQQTVFISYRRSTSSFIARAVFMDLRANGYDAFLDIETIDSGAFDRIILNQIAARAHFVLILAPGTLDRCANPDDWLKREIEEAIRLGRNIVPLMVGDFTFAGTEHYLTGTLSLLPRFNAIKVFHEYFDEAMMRLRERYLRPPQMPVIEPTPNAEQAIVTRKISEASQNLPTARQLEAESLLMRAYARSDDDLEGQIADFTEAIRLFPQYVEAFNQRGMTYIKKNDYDAALNEFTQAVGLDTQFAEAYFNRGNVLVEKKDFSGALQDYERAIKASPENFEDHNEKLQLLRAQYAITCHNVAQRYFLAKQYREALELHKKANTVMPAFNLTLVGLALNHHALGHITEAVRIWRFLISCDPRYGQAEWVFEKWQLSSEPFIEELRKLLARV
jgi:tetratricopeptide (TPR) repeat protein